MAMTSTHLKKGTASANRLLAVLPPRNLRNVLASCDRVKLDFAKVMSESGAKIHYVYFPLDGFISLITALDDGSRLEVGMVGDEGMLGTSLMLGVDISAQHALVQGAGNALRMRTATFLNHYRSYPALRHTLNRYLYVLMSQLAQNAACTHYHRVEARLARWLLLTRDCAHSDRFALTHQFLAYMLGVRRVGITEAATALQQRGLINYTRGKITILDVKGLERASCKCYAAGKEIYKRILQ